MSQKFTSYVASTTHKMISKRKVRAFVTDEKGQPRAGIVVVIRDRKNSQIIAVQQTDHAGYVSFGLLAREDGSGIEAASGMSYVPVKGDTEESTSDVHIEVLNAPEVHLPFRKEEEVMVLTVPSSLNLPATNRSWLPAVTHPDAIDRKLSPMSFATARAVSVGSAACDVILPAMTAQHVFRFTQLIPRLSDGSESELKRGHLLSFRVSWFPTGHSLGDLMYSLPLAPCETVNMAVVDWSRQDYAARVEEATARDQIVHDQLRDRMIEETMNGSVAERQTGISFLTGVAGSYSQGQYSIAGATGVGYNESNGLKVLAGETVQAVTDRAVQVSSSMRQIASSAVVQASQAEHAAAATRAVTNHNHCHAMTVLYFSVLRQFRIVTEFTERIPILLVPYDTTTSFDTDRAATLRHLLQPALLDRKLDAAFNALVEPVTSSIEESPAETATTGETQSLKRLKIIIQSGSAFPPKDCGLAIQLVLRSFDALVEKELIPPSDIFWGAKQEKSFMWVLEPDAIDLADIALIRLVFSNQQQNTLGQTGRTWQLSKISINYETASGRGTLYAGEPKMLFHAGKGGETAMWEAAVNIRPSTTSPAPLPPPPPAAPVARVLVDTLLAHLNANLVYYNRVVALEEDADARAIRFLDQQYAGRSLLEQIENRPVGSFAGWLAYPLRNRDAQEELDQIDAKADEPQENWPEPVEEWISLPTRGVFAEIELGRCNSCEPIDDTRFWDWQRSPCPERAPALGPVSTDSRNQSIIPTSSPAFPAPLVSIQGAPAAPDPTGLGSLIASLVKGDTFRDMSGREELAELLSKLAEAVKPSSKQKEPATDTKKENGESPTSDRPPTGPSTSGQPRGQSGTGGTTPQGGSGGSAPQTGTGSAPQRVNNSSPRPNAPAENSDDSSATSPGAPADRYMTTDHIVSFRIGSTQLREVENGKLRTFFKAMGSPGLNAEVTVIQGIATSDGPEDQNHRLALGRANVVRDFIQNNGLCSLSATVVVEGKIEDGVGPATWIWVRYRVANE